jgi:hypothetical protein
MNAGEIDSGSYQGIASAMPNVACFRCPIRGSGERSDYLCGAI